MTDASSPFVKDPLFARYVGGGLPEAEALFGCPLPLLPPAELDRDRQVFFVRFHPHLRTILQRFLESLLSRLEAEATSTPPPESNRAQAEYEQTLRRIIRSARSVDRRMGLLNLFWISHARDVAACLADLERKLPVVEGMKRVLPPLLAPLYRRVDAAARGGPRTPDGTTDLDRFREGGPENTALLRALTEDGYYFVENKVEELDLERFIVANKRLRYTAKLFSEVETVLIREVEARLAAAEAGLIKRIEHHLPGLPRDERRTPSGVRKIALNTQVMAYLLADPWYTGATLLAGPVVTNAAARRAPSDIIAGFLEVVEALKRFEILCHVGDTVRLGQGIFAEEELDEKVRGGARVYEFAEAAQVLNSAVNATVLFLDLRGFTETSEGQVSERDLTRELYNVFDAFVPIIRRFGGLVDKFLGDGMMVTFGTVLADPCGPLHAVRTAILCQEALQEIRQRGHSEFRMGVSVHYGRVYVARFFEDERTTQVTVIGRNVNLAGRLSSAAKKPIDEEEDEPETEAPALRVSVDARGALVNEGIALSRAAFVQLESQVGLESVQDGDRQLMHYVDEELERRVVIRYGGDAKFKGVRASFPVFEVTPQPGD